MNIQPKLQSASISRDYVTGYTTALASDKVDGNLFATIEAQRHFFTGKVDAAKRAHRDNLHTALADLGAAKKQTKDKKELAELDLAVSAAALELASL